MSMLYVVGSGGEAGGEGRKEAVRKGGGQAERPQHHNLWALAAT